MGMYPVQNYGKDFNESFVGMGNFLSGQRKAESDLKQREIDNTRQTRMDEQAKRVADANIAASEASTNKNVFDLDKSKAEAEKTKDLERVMGMVTRYKPGQPGGAGAIELSPEELQAFSNASVRMSNMPNNIINPVVRSRYAADNALLNKGYSLLDSMAASGSLFAARRGDDPEIDAALDAKERLMPKEPLVKQHRNEAYGDYTLAKLEQIGVISGEGTAKTADWFSIKDKAGNFIYEKNEDGTPVTVTDPKTGAVVPKKVLVPSTFGHTNDPESKVKFDLSALEQAKGQLGVQLLSLYERLTPQQQQQIQENNIATLRASSSPVAVEFLKRWDEKEEKVRSQKQVQDIMKGLPADASVSEITRALVDKGIPAKDARDYGTALAKEKKTIKPIEKPLGGDRYQQVVINDDGTETKWGGVYSKKTAAGVDPITKMMMLNEYKDARESKKAAQKAIDESFAKFDKRRSEINKIRTKFLAENPVDSDGYKAGIADLNNELESVRSDGEAYTQQAQDYVNKYREVYQPGAGKNTQQQNKQNTPNQAQQKQKQTQAPATTATPAASGGYIYSGGKMIPKVQAQAQPVTAAPAVAGMQSKPQPQQKQEPYNFFAAVNSGKELTAKEIYAKSPEGIESARIATVAAAKKTPSDKIVSIPLPGGKTLRTEARNAKFNERTLQWEKK
jgi:hypothetical protein